MRIVASISQNVIARIKQDHGDRAWGSFCYKRSHINNDPNKKTSGSKNLDIQLTSHEASRYLAIAKWSEFLSLSSCPGWYLHCLIASSRAVIPDMSPRSSWALAALPRVVSTTLARVQAHAQEMGPQKTSTIWTSHWIPWASMPSSVKSR